MSENINTEKKQFELTGKFSGFLSLEGYELKYLQLNSTEGEYVIKIPKELRLPLYKTLRPGDLITCQGESKHNQLNGQSKWKAYSIDKITEKNHKQSPKIVICQGSACLKRGSQRLSEVLQAQLEQENLDQQVEITTTGCLKNCKQGVNLIVMPEKAKYCQVQTQQLATIISRLTVANVTK